MGMRFMLTIRERQTRRKLRGLDVWKKAKDFGTASNVGELESFAAGEVHSCVVCAFANVNVFTSSSPSTSAGALKLRRKVKQVKGRLSRKFAFQKTTL